MPENPIHDDERIDRMLRGAGARMRAAVETAQTPMIRPSGAHEPPRRWIVPVVIVITTAAAAVAAVWIAGPATESIREAPADTGVDPRPEPSVDSVPAVGPIVSTPPSDTDPPIAAESGEPVIAITEADFDRAGGMCVRLVLATDSADACLTNRQLQDTPTWTVAFAEQAFEVTLGRLDPDGISATAVDDVCGYAPAVLVHARWLNIECAADQHFWFVAAPETAAGVSTTFVVPPRTGQVVALEPIASAFPDGYTVYSAEFDTDYRCLVVASFPDPWREACFYSHVPRLLVPSGGSVYLVESAPDMASVDVHDIATLSVPIAGCTAPIDELAAPLSSSEMISGLICAGDAAMITVPAVFLQYGPPDGAGYPLERAADGSWSTVGGGTSFPCDVDPLPTCAALGVGDDLMAAPLPIPPWGLIGAREHDLDPVEVTAEVRSVSGGARTADEIAASVIARYGAPDAEEGLDPVIAVVDELGLVTVDIDVLDDSVTSEGYAVWFEAAEDGTLVVERAYRITACGRGIAAPDLCV